MARLLLGFVLAAGMALACNVTRGDDKKADDPKALDGEYTVVSVLRDGKEDESPFRKGIQGVTIKDGTLTIKAKVEGKEDAKSAKLKLDTSKKPAQMDIIPTDGPEKDKATQAIFSTEKGELKMAWTEGPPDKAARPKDFTSTADNKVMIVTLKKK